MRLVNRVLAALLSLALLAAAVLIIATVVADRTSHHQGIVPWRTAYHWARTPPGRQAASGSPAGY